MPKLGTELRLCKSSELPYIETMSEEPKKIPPKTKSPEARRALAEAEQRRAKAAADEKDLPAEQGGRGGKDPARFGDWEVNGRAIDF